MATPVRFWVDPVCPWCWVTASWVRRIADERDLVITWEPISLFLKNSPAPDSEYYASLAWTHGLLRVLEAVRSTEGDEAVGALYLEYGRRIHHDGVRLWDPADALQAIGLDVAHAAAAGDERWESEIRRRMDSGLALVGTDVGTPIVAVRDDDGGEVALFGPVITKVPALKDSLVLWDALTALASMEEFHELKRTRTGRPEVGERP